MNVLGIEWRDIDPHETKFPTGEKRRRPPHPPVEPEDDDVVEIHGESAEEAADGLDVVE